MGLFLPRYFVCVSVPLRGSEQDPHKLRSGKSARAFCLGFRELLKLSNASSVSKPSSMEFQVYINLGNVRDIPPAGRGHRVERGCDQVLSA